MIGNHKTSVINDNSVLMVCYHSTPVVKITDDKIILNSGGWETPTTKDRMNATAYENNLPYRVYQKDYIWYVTLDNKCYRFRDNMQIDYVWIHSKYTEKEINGRTESHWFIKDIKPDEKETKRYYKNIVTQNEGV